MIYQVVYSGGDYEEYDEKPVIVTDNYEKAVEAANKLASTINAFGGYGDIDVIEVRRFSMNQYLINKADTDRDSLGYLGYDYKYLWWKPSTRDNKLIMQNDDWDRMDLP